MMINKVVSLLNVLLQIPHYLYSALTIINVTHVCNAIHHNYVAIERQWSRYNLPLLKELIYSFLSPSELISIFKIKFGGYVKKMPKQSLDQLAHTLNDRDFCYVTLNKVSRSFAIVIQQLPQPLKDSVCVFYLVLRGLDSIEDDMTYPEEDKIFLLNNFYKNLLVDNWSIRNVGDTTDYRILLENFSKVINIFKLLDKKDQSIILDITCQMGTGMAEYVGKTGSVETLTSYNSYCHYVAGLVGYGLSALFVNSGLEDTDLHNLEHLSNHMGLFLQKTNIIRDYLEDLQAGRTWWPKEIWQNYAVQLDEFSKNPYGEQSLECLNHMVTDSLSHLPDVIDYLSRLKNRKILEFCAIPQVMAMATLAKLYNNPLVFQSVVKIRKGLTCKLMLSCSSRIEVLAWFDFFIREIESKIPINFHVNTHRMHQLVDQMKILFHKN